MAKHIDDMLVKNATVWCGDPPSPARGWFSVKDGVISAIGTDSRLPDSGRVVDAENKVVLPSFVDCHTHLSSAALMNIAKTGVHWRSKRDALDDVRKHAAFDPSSEWLLYFYANWESWNDPTPPDARELEHAAPGRNVLISCVSLHRGVLSETGFQTASIDRQSHQRFIDMTRGRPTGVVWEECFSSCLLRALTSLGQRLGDDGVADLLLAEARRHLSAGITDAHDPTMTPSVSPIMSEVRRKTPLRLSWSAAGGHGPLSSADSDHVLSDYGDGPSSAKVFADGAHRCAMCIDPAAALKMGIHTIQRAARHMSWGPIRQLFSGRTSFEGGRLCRKGEIFETNDLTRRLLRLGRSHERVKIHALGNQAVDMACDCVAEAGLTTRVCLEHATLIDDNVVDKLTQHRIQVSLQSGFLPTYGPLFVQMGLGEKYRGLAARSMLDAGVDMFMSSDYPCGPLDPLHNMRCAVDRRLPDGRPYLEMEAVTPEEAVYGYTLGAMKGITGRAKAGIEVGAPADFVILSSDPFQHGAVVESTWIAGDKVYDHGEA